jgi:hypothetical protein
MSLRLLLGIVVGLVVTGSPVTAKRFLIRPGVRPPAVDAPAAPTKPSTARAVELTGAVRIGGRPASNVRLMFHPDQGVQRAWRTRLKSDGSYKIKFKAGATHVICARIELSRPFNSYSTCQRFSAGAHRLDFDFPPGVIRVEVPPARRRVPALATVRVEGVKGGAGRTFKPAKGFRGDYFAADVGTYIVTIIDPEREDLLASWPVKITADQPVVGIKLPISRK